MRASHERFFHDADVASAALTQDGEEPAELWGGVRGGISPVHHRLLFVVHILASRRTMASFQTPLKSSLNAGGHPHNETG